MEHYNRMWRSVLVWLVAVTVSAGCMAQPDRPSTQAASASQSVAQKLQGYWHDPAARVWLGFEGEYCCFNGDLGLPAGGSLPDHGYVAYRNNAIVLQRWQPFVAVRREVTWKDDRLVLTGGQMPLELVRLPAKPPELTLTPIRLGLAKALPTERAAQIRKELAKRFQFEQQIRQELVARATSLSAARDREAEIHRKMQEDDERNRDYMRNLVSEVGWIDATRFGAATSSHAMMLVQKSGDIALMLAALPGLEEDIRAKRLGGQSFAMLYDRAQTFLNRRQRYGTQVVSSNISSGGHQGGFYLYPLEEPATVDQRRAELGMDPLQKYLSMLQQIYRTPAIESMETLIAADPTPSTQPAFRASNISGTLRFDGVYKGPSEAAGGGLTGNRYIRFYPEGTVITAFVLSGGSVQEIEHWFVKSGSNLTHSHFQKAGSHVVEFEFAFPRWQVTYRVDVRQNSLQAEITKKGITGARTEAFEFVPFVPAAKAQ